MDNEETKLSDAFLRLVDSNGEIHIGSEATLSYLRCIRSIELELKAYRKFAKKMDSLFIPDRGGKKASGS